MEIRYRHQAFLLLAMLPLLFSACKKTETANVANWPVVIGYITPGQPISVKVYQQKNIADTAIYGPLIGGLKLTVSDGTQSIALTETTTGTYTYSGLTFLTAGKTYTLQFTYNNTTVTASTLMPAKPTHYTSSRTAASIPSSSSSTIDSIAFRFKWDNPDSLYHVLVFKNYNGLYYNIRMPANSPNFTINAEKASLYDVRYRTLNYIGTFDVILYSVNKEYIDQLTSNANSTSQKLADPPTNMTNGFGVFTATQSDTIRVTLSL
jgi:hypothetical protein